MPMARAMASGMECVTGIPSTVKGPTGKDRPGSRMVLEGTSTALSWSLRLSRPMVRGDAKTGMGRRFRRKGAAPMWSSWPWVRTRPTTFSAFSSR